MRHQDVNAFVAVSNIHQRIGLFISITLLFISCKDAKPIQQGLSLPPNEIYAYSLPCDTIETSSSDPALSQAEYWDSFRNCNSFIDTTVVIEGAEYTILLENKFMNQLEKVPILYANEKCKFSIKENIIGNYELSISIFKNKRLLFRKKFDKYDFKDVLEKNYLRQNVLAGAKLFYYNEKTKSFIFLINFSAIPGGTDWYGQAYLIIDENGNIQHKGLVDYPHHCEGFFSITGDKRYILTCSEFIDLYGQKYSFKKEVTFAKFLNDSLYSVIYAYTNDSLLCDTMAYYKKDTLRYTTYLRRADTLSPNAYIMHVKGDTLAQFQFSGYFNHGEGYAVECELLKNLCLIGFYDYRRKILRVFDWEKKLKEATYSVERLKKLKKQSNIIENEDYMQFHTFEQGSSNLQLIRFYINSSKRVIGYRLLNA
jgi:hypothetical protein